MGSTREPSRGPFTFHIPNSVVGCNRTASGLKHLPEIPYSKQTIRVTILNFLQNCLVHVTKLCYPWSRLHEERSLSRPGHITRLSYKSQYRLIQQKMESWYHKLIMRSQMSRHRVYFPNRCRFWTVEIPNRFRFPHWNSQLVQIANRFENLKYRNRLAIWTGLKFQRLGIWTVGNLKWLRISTVRNLNRLRISTFQNLHRLGK